VRDIVVNGRTTKDVPVLFGVYSHSLVVKLSRSHLQMRALKRVLCRLRCMPTAHMRRVFGSYAASHPQVVPANIELVSVIARHTLFSQWNQMIQTLTNKLTPQKRAFTGAAPTISVSLDQLSRCTPSAAVVQCWVLNLAIEQEIIMARLVSQHRVFGQSDGGQKGQEVRVLSLRNQETGKIVEYWSGLTYCGKKSNQVANGMKRDLARLSYPEACKKLSGSCSDLGAGTPESFAAAFDKIVIWEADGMEDSCGLHDCMSLFRLPCNTWIGEGALAKRNAVQLLHTLWSFWSVLSKTKKWVPIVQKLWKKFSDDEEIPTGLFDAEPPSELINALQCPLIIALQAMISHTRHGGPVLVNCPGTLSVPRPAHVIDIHLTATLYYSSHYSLD
jgi:hypothetical protein